MKISDNDLKIMYEISKDVHGDDEIEIIKGVLNQIEYAELVSNL